MANEYKIPDLGGAADVDVIEVSVSVGDVVEAEQTLVVLETDKASMEIPAETSGTIEALSIQVGDKVNEGDVFISIASSAGAGSQPEVAQDNVASESVQPEAANTETVPAETTHTESREQAIVVPDLGGSESVEVIELAVAVGDVIDAEQTILVLESDKATMEIPAGEAGTIVSLAVAVGDKVSQGDAMLTLMADFSVSVSVSDSTVADKPQRDNSAVIKPEATSATSTTSTATPANSTATAESAAANNTGSESHTGGEIHAGPAVRKLAREFGVDLSQVSATGRRGRITKDDVQLFVKQRLNSSTMAVGSGMSGAGIPAVPEVDFAKFGSITSEPLNNIKRATAKAMTTAWLNVPQVTQFDQADITDLEAYRKQQNQRYQSQGIRFSIVPFVLKAIAKVLREFPQFCASLSADGESLILKDYVHIGVAVDTPKGLLVPVIRNVDQLSVTEITQQLNEKAQLAREGKLTLSDMQGGCFSLSSLGGIGGTAFTPIVNPPEVAILGLSKAEMKPVWNGQEFVPQLMLPLSLSYDHRVIDGAEAARFSQRLVDCLQDLRNVLM
ncbi:dihydrolipoyllysine-residue acetyltransferase [Bacterioplanoides sp.]|uniref:dihydrolipoyllysine-residue acetyltransferase n=1 Tax=Bacterioplanoides sp. TaxID=2066072 RepID=UPI003B00877B